MTDRTETIFFAYQGKVSGKADENVDAIKGAVRGFNQHQKRYHAETWEDYKETRAISKEVLAAISAASVFVADLTYFNHNVLFELGYAVGKDREILILLNENINNSKNIYRDFILRNVRYTAFSNSGDIQGALQKKYYRAGLFKEHANAANLARNSNDLLYIQSKVKTQPSLDLGDTVENARKSLRFSTIVDDAQEIAYRPIEWYFQNIYKSSRILIHLLGQSSDNGFIENAGNAFWAGLASGLGNHVLLTAPSKFKAPLDYEEILVQYESAEDLCAKIKVWLESQFEGVITEPKEVHALNLIKLGVGCEVAEQEQEGLLHYFVETASYQVAMRQERTMILGRKGSGKSAIYIKAANALSRDPNNFVIALKPESIELLEDIELASVFSSPASKLSFLFTVWRHVIISKLALIVCDRVLERQAGAGFTANEELLLKFQEKHGPFMQLNAFGALREITERIQKSSDPAPKVLEAYHEQYLGPLIRLLKEYFSAQKSKFLKVILLADNLDKTWDAKHDLDVQSDLILSLLETQGKIQRDLSSKGQDVQLRSIVFLRKDIFEYILKAVNEPDKLVAMSHEIDWENHPELLRRMLGDRFRVILELPEDADIEAVWTEFFAISSKEHPFDVIDQIVTRRPRDLIYFVSRLFESAVNRGHEKIVFEDLTYAIESYTSFLNNNLIAETRAEYPEVASILSKLQEHHGKVLEYTELAEILASHGYDDTKKNRFVSTLFEKGYMLGFDEKTSTPFSDFKGLQERLNARRYLFFKNKVFVIAHAKYYLIKNKQLTPF
ncbi:MAG: hypothetical protein HY079_03970 [Elusimicrobia bacterium]|nr:hypothetical protein [Elusimicrobiota bacterium]